ncbi:MAG: BamA/TamA family outer membrane protein [bacterium]
MRRFLMALAAIWLLTVWMPPSSEGMDRTTLRWMRSKPTIDSITVTGNSYFKTSEIRKQMYSRPHSFWRWLKGDRRTRIQRETFERDTLEVKYLYLTKGFLGVTLLEDAEILAPDSSALIRLQIDEGRQFFYGNIGVTGSFNHQLEGDFSKIAGRQKTGKPVNIFNLHTAVFDIKTVLANEGYPYAMVTFNLDTSHIEPSADITISVVSDSLVRFGDVRVEGTQRYPEKVARRELKIRPGAIYRRNDIIESQRRLIESGYFSTFHLARADTLADRLRPDFVLRVRERKPTYLTVKTGVGQSEVRDLTWDFSTGFGKRNFLGTRLYDLRAQLSFGVGHDTRLLGHNYRIRFTEPWLLGIRMPLSLTGRYEPGVKDPVQDYRIQTWSVSVSTFRNFGHEIRSGLGLEYEEVNIFGVPDDLVELKKEERDISVRRKLYLTFRRDSRDNIFIPRRGSLTDITLEYYGGFLGGDEYFYKWQAGWSSYQVMWPGWISATRFRVGVAEEFGTSIEVPVDDRFYLGGANTVRGFRENSLGPAWEDGNPRGADITVVLNQEFRWRTLQVMSVIPVLNSLFRTLPLWQTVFLDVGNGFAHTADLRVDAMAVSYGTGIQIVSPAGPIRVDYARRIKTKRIDFDDRWHFTILYAF